MGFVNAAINGEEENQSQSATRTPESFSVGWKRLPRCVPVLEVQQPRRQQAGG